MLPCGTEFMFELETPPEQQHEHQDHQQGWKEPPDAGRVELPGQGTCGSLMGGKAAGDEEAGKDEEDIDTDRPPRQQAGCEVIDHHQQHRDPAQAVQCGQVREACGGGHGAGPSAAAQGLRPG